METEPLWHRISPSIQLCLKQSWTFLVQEAINSLFCSSWLELVFCHLRFKES